MPDSGRSAGVVVGAAPLPRETAGAQSFLTNMQVLRFVAALMVLVSHLVREIGRIGLDGGVVGTIESAGVPWACGVDLFFMISGFLMLYLSWDRFASPGFRREFLKRRFIRVIPLYWLATAGFVVITLVRPGAIIHGDISVEHVTTSLLFIPSLRASGGTYPVLVLGWTLNYEILFYLAFSLVLGLQRPRALLVLSAAFLAASLYNLAAGPSLPAIRFWTDPIILEFALGAALCWLYKRRLRLSLAARMGCILAGIALLILATKLGISETEVQTSTVPRIAWAGIPCALVVAGFMLGAQLDTRSRLVRLMVTGGDISYSLYLTHMFATRALTILYRAAGASSGWVFFVCGIALALCLALAVYRLVEAPVLGVLRRQFEARRPVRWA